MILSLGLNLFVKFINLDSEYDIILLNWGCNMSKGKKLFILILFILLVGGISYLVYLNMVTAPFITSIEKSDDKRFPNKIIINVHVDNYFYKLNKDVWCYITTDKEEPDVNNVALSFSLSELMLSVVYIFVSSSIKYLPTYEYSTSI